MAGKSKKTTLLKKANELGISTFGEPNVSELERRISLWLPGGFLVRKLYQKQLPEWAGDIPDEIIWLPNCNQTRKLLTTKKFLIIGIKQNPPKDVKVIDPSNLKIVEEEE